MEIIGVKEFMAKGEIKIHGISQKISIPAKLNFGKNNFVVESEFILRPKDFNIKIPRILIKNIAEEVLVKVNLVYEVMP
jgi:polyisoprenoid-binding protein YceI